MGKFSKHTTVQSARIAAEKAGVELPVSQRPRPVKTPGLQSVANHFIRNGWPTNMTKEQAVAELYPTRRPNRRPVGDAPISKSEMARVIDHVDRTWVARVPKVVKLSGITVTPIGGGRMP